MPSNFRNVKKTFKKVTNFSKDSTIVLKTACFCIELIVSNFSRSVKYSDKMVHFNFKLWDKCQACKCTSVMFLPWLVTYLFISTAVASNELTNERTSSLNSSANGKPVLPFVDSLEGVEFLAEMALHKYRQHVDQGPDGQVNDLGTTVAYSAKINNLLSEILDSIGEVSFNRTAVNESDNAGLSYFKTICDRYASLTNLKSQGSVSESKFNSLCDILTNNKCLSAETIMKILKDNSQSDVSLTLPQAVARICPLILFQSQDSSCLKSTNGELQDESTGILSSTIEKQPVATTQTRPSASAVWGFGFLFVTVVSCCSLVGVALLPLFSKKVYHMVLVHFEGLAVGSLSASALFHLIPQAFGLLGQENYHDYLWKSLVIFLGIYVFFIMERCMKIIIQRKQKRKLKKAMRNVDTASVTLSPDLSSNEKNHLDDNLPNVFIASSLKIPANGTEYVAKIVEQDVETQLCLPVTNNTHSHHGHSHFQPSTEGANGKREIATVAWMIIFGDGFHNFIDGLSMGAAFSNSILSGISISVAVICEEFPHELGDFAVLLSSGMTMKQALMYNFLSACTCYLGLIFGIILGDFSEGGTYIFAFAGGMFLYISLVDMVNELSEALESASAKGTKEMLRVFGLQNLGILIGVLVMFIMARYSENINFAAGGF